MIELLHEGFAALMVACLLVLLLAGFPVAFTLMGVAVSFALFGNALGLFSAHLLSALPLRIVGLMDNDLLQAIPLFVYLGVILQRTTIAADLLETMAGLFANRAGGLGISSIILGMLLAPTTGVVGATVLTIGLLALPSMLSAGYDRRFASGIVCCAGTLGTIVPPSIILIMLSGQMRYAAHDAATQTGHAIRVNFRQIYMGSVLPVGLLLCCYLAYVVLVSIVAPRLCPARPAEQRPRLTLKNLFILLIAPISLIVLMLASILTALLHTVEAAAIGAIAITIFATFRGELTFERLAETVREVMRLTAMVFALLMGALTFTLVFRMMGGDVTVAKLLAQVPGGLHGAVLAVLTLSLVFCLFLDALEILLIVIPLTMPSLLVLGGDPIWLAVMFAIAVQTGFLMPPSGFAICFLRSVAPPKVQAPEIYAGVVAILAIQVLVLMLLWTYPGIATWLPSYFGSSGSGTF